MSAALVHLFNSSSVSGPERLVLPALRAAGWPCAVVNLVEERLPGPPDGDPLSAYARRLGVDCGAVRVRRRWDGAAVTELRGLLDRLAPALVHAHDAKASAYLLAAGAAGPPPRWRTVSTHHGVHGRPDLKSRAYEWLYRRFVLPRFDRALAVSGADVRFLAAHALGRERLRLHLNGVDGLRVAPDERRDLSRRARAAWLPGEAGREGLFLMGTVGRLSAEKDHARLLLVLERLDRLGLGRDWRCLVFGAGPLEADLKGRARRLDLGRRVVWMGYRPEVAGELAGLDLVASFSTAEGLPISLLEAGWAGTPVIATNVGGIGDILPDESFGTLVPPQEPPAATAERLRGLLAPERRTGLEAQGRRLQARVAQVFSSAAWLKRLADIYGELGVALESRPALGRGA